MIEILLGIGLCVVMARIASADDQSAILWGSITAALCLACLLLIPWPFVRFLIAGALAFLGLIASKALRSR